jgi:hypothetical protein
MIQILAWLGSLFTSLFTAQAGTKVAEIVARRTLILGAFAGWIACVASFTYAAASCSGVGGYCATYVQSIIAGSNFGNVGGLTTNWAAFGLALIPVEFLQIIQCVIALHLMGWTFFVVTKFLRDMSKQV